MPIWRPSIEATGVWPLKVPERKASSALQAFRRTFCPAETFGPPKIVKLENDHF